MNTSAAPQEWQRFWFTMPAERRASIEAHLETCQTLISAIDKLDMNDRGQHPIWKQIRETSGWYLKDVGPHARLDRTQIGRYERGQRIPGKDVAPRYHALLANLATDQYHHHISRLTWALHHAEAGNDAPEIIAPEPDFLKWADQKHPLLDSIPAALPYNDLIAWPIQNEKAET
jgi:hypothetical protein